MEDVQKSNSNMPGKEDFPNKGENSTQINKGTGSSSKESVSATGVDDLQSNSDGAAGTDRAGTAERKTYGDIELNKGLEAQAKDEES